MGDAGRECHLGQDIIYFKITRCDLYQTCGYFYQQLFGISLVLLARVAQNLPKIKDCQIMIVVTINFEPFQNTVIATYTLVIASSQRNLLC